EGVLGEVTSDAPVQRHLAAACNYRAMALYELKRYSEALKALDRTVELAPAWQRPTYAMNRALTRVRVGQVEVGINEAEGLISTANADGLYNAGCLFALASASPSAKGPAQREKYAQRAVEMIH